jgi:hypothetical protein
MGNIYFEDFRLLVYRHAREIEKGGPEAHTMEWFLARYLRRIIKAAEEPASPNRIEGTLRSLIRFYVDNLDENSDLGRRCTDIYEAYRKTIRESREQE